MDPVYLVSAIVRLALILVVAYFAARRAVALAREGRAALHQAAWWTAALLTVVLAALGAWLAWVF